MKYRIVGEFEADLKQRRVSITSPIARALIGREVGDAVQVQAPGGRGSTRFSRWNSSRIRPPKKPDRRAPGQW